MTSNRMMLAPALAVFPAGMLLGFFSRVLAHRLLRGRCESCGRPIRPRYPLIEVGSGALWVGTFLAAGDDPSQLALGLALCTVLVTVTLTDLDLRVIPNELLLTGALAGISIAALFDPSGLPERGVAALAAGGLLFPVAFVHPQGMGMGDAKLVTMMGIYLGRSIAPAVVVGFAAGALLGVTMIARHGVGARKRAIPFGPFLALGGFVGLWFGDSIVDWYTNELLASA